MSQQRNAAGKIALVGRLIVRIEFPILGVG
jgi:hypothetical protein